MATADQGRGDPEPARRCLADIDAYQYPQGAGVNATLYRIAILIRKELIAILKDPRSRLVLFVPIVLQSLLFGYAATFDLDAVHYALLDSDRSTASKDLIA